MNYYMYSSFMIPLNVISTGINHKPSLDINQTILCFMSWKTTGKSNDLPSMKLRNYKWFVHILLSSAAIWSLRLKFQEWMEASVPAQREVWYLACCMWFQSFLLIGWRLNGAVPSNTDLILPKLPYFSTTTLSLI